MGMGTASESLHTHTQNVSWSKHLMVFGMWLIPMTGPFIHLSMELSVGSTAVCLDEVLEPQLGVIGFILFWQTETRRTTINQSTYLYQMICRNWYKRIWSNRYHEPLDWIYFWNCVKYLCELTDIGYNYNGMMGLRMGTKEKSINVFKSDVLLNRITIPSIYY